MVEYCLSPRTAASGLGKTFQANFSCFFAISSVFQNFLRYFPWTRHPLFCARRSRILRRFHRFFRRKRGSFQQPACPKIFCAFCQISFHDLDFIYFPLFLRSFYPKFSLFYPVHTAFFARFCPSFDVLSPPYSPFFGRFVLQKPAFARKDGFCLKMDIYFLQPLPRPPRSGPAGFVHPDGQQASHRRQAASRIVP